LPSEPTVLAIDHGTSGIKAALVTVRGAVLDFEFAATPIRFLPGGGAEQDPDDWWNALVRASRALVDRGTPEDIVAVCVSSTWSSTVAVDGGGHHLMNALTWMDSRGASHVQRAMKGLLTIEGYGVGNLLRWVPRTGGIPSRSGKDDIAHLMLVQHDFPEIYRQTAAFLPSKDYLNLRLSGELAASTDSITLFWVTDNRDIHRVRYDDGLIRRLGIDRDKLPPLRAATDVLGSLRPEVADALGLAPTVKVICGSPDHQSALVGSGAVRDFEGHLYIGTSSWVQCPVPFKRTDVLHSIASLPSAIPGRYQSVNEQDIAGGALSFLADNVAWYGGPSAGERPDNPYRVLDEMAARAPAGSGGVIALPWLHGERSPVDDEHLRGGLFNLSVTTTADHMVRATLEGVAYNTRWNLQYVDRFAKHTLAPLRFVGGGARSDLWSQIFADVFGRPIHRVTDPMQANARGAALIAGVALGYIDWSEIPDLVEIDRVFTPDPANRTLYDGLFAEFLALHKALRPVYRRLNR